jgi:hypothetical protein
MRTVYALCDASGSIFFCLSFRYLFFPSICVTQQDPLSLSQLWRRFYSLKRQFLTNYRAYQHYKAGGWVVRCGLGYGVDFLLYFQGPQKYHSTYASFLLSFSLRIYLFVCLFREDFSTNFSLLSVSFSQLAMR